MPWVTVYNVKSHEKNNTYMVFKCVAQLLSSASWWCETIKHFWRLPSCANHDASFPINTLKIHNLVVKHLSWTVSSVYVLWQSDMSSPRDNLWLLRVRVGKPPAAPTAAAAIVVVVLSLCDAPLRLLYSGNRRRGLDRSCCERRSARQRVWWWNFLHPQVTMSECPERSSRISLLREPLLRRLCEVLDRSSNRGWRKLGELVNRDRRLRVRWAQVTQWVAAKCGSTAFVCPKLQPCLIAYKT